jgi:DNA-binding MarR family transcriptional regulator
LNEDDRIIDTVEYIHDKVFLIRKRQVAYFENFLAPRGLTFLQFHILFKVGRNKMLRVSQLADLVGIHLSSLTRLLDRLIEQDLIYRYHDDEDRRVVRVELTETGSEQVNQIIADYKTGFFNLIRNFDGPDLEDFFQFAALLDKISLLFQIENIERTP